MTRRRSRVLRRTDLPVTVGAGVAAVALGTAAVGGVRAWALRAARGRLHSPDTSPAVDAAVVLGAGLTPSGRPSVYLAARLDRALELHRLGKAPVIVVSGAAPEGADEPRAMRTYLEQRGVSPDVIVEDRRGIDTYATCRRARRVFGLRRIALVSQGYHLPRALALASAVGLDAVGVADWTVQDHVQTSPVTWVIGEVREWVAGLKVLADVVRPRPEDEAPRDPRVRDALARAGAAYDHPTDGA